MYIYIIYIYYVYIYYIYILYIYIVVGNFCSEKLSSGKILSRKVMNFFKKNRHFSRFLSIRHLILWREKIPYRFLKSTFIYLKKKQGLTSVLWSMPL